MPLTAEEFLLLAAATGDGDEAVASWGRLRPHLELDAISYEQRELIPLVYRKLSAAGATDPEMPRLKGIYRYTWAANQPFVSELAAAVAALDECQLDVTLAGDAALAAGYHRDLGACSIRDLHIELVDGLARAGAALERLGWQPAGKRSEVDLLSFRKATHACRSMTLLAGRRQSHADDRLQSLALQGRSLPIAGPGQELMRVCCEAAGTANRSWLRPAASFLTVCKIGGESIDWQWAASRATAMGCTRELEVLAGLAAAVSL